MPRTADGWLLDDRVPARYEVLREFEWDESLHPRGKTTDASTDGSFAPAGGGGSSGRGKFAPSEAGALLAAALASGGFTYQPHAHQNAPPKGYAMSVSVQNEKVVPLAEATEQSIAEYIDSHADLFTDPDTYVGAWIDPASGKLVLDVSKVVEDRDTALDLARTYKQEAIYDLEKGESIQVGAQGEKRRFVIRPGAAAVQPAHHDAAGDRGGDHGQGSRRPRIVPHTPDGRPRLVSMTAFQNAVRRADFAVIDRRSELVSADSALQMARMVAKAVLKALGSRERIAALLTTDLAAVQYVKLDGPDVGRLKAIAKDALSKGWAIGAESARREVLQARGTPAVASFSTLGDRAADYFEANGFRMAANVSDGVRSIIQQVLIQAAKEGIRPEDVTPVMFRALIDRGFTTLPALELEALDPGMLGRVAELLRLPAAANVAAYLNTLVRTNLFEALNEARFAEFTNPALGGFVRAFEYSAILDDRTTELCTELDGMVFAADSPEWAMYLPPNHYNCRSMLIAITESDEWDGVESDTPRLLPAEGFGSMLEKQERAAEAEEAEEAERREGEA